MIDKLEFWKDRIADAKLEHHSVYLVNDTGWKMINERHKSVFDEVIPKTATVLDLGCGYGRWSEYFSNYTGVDFSPDFIDIAKKKYPNKKFLVADLKALPFKDKEFDWGALVSIRKMIKHYLGNDVWPPMEQEIKRVCKKVLVLEYDSEQYEIL